MQITKEKWQGKMLEVSTAWSGLEDYMISIMNTFKIKPGHGLEFGVDKGYSTYILSQLFEQFTGVDAFIGDSHINHAQGDEFYREVLQKFQETNVNLVRADFRDFIRDNNDKYYDLIHIDIVHFYDETYQCAEWAIQHSDVVILHDTESFPEVKRVCTDISSKYKVNFSNITQHHGLGILHRYNGK
jgi:predicted O-methyltransferase YrrM